MNTAHNLTSAASQTTTAPACPASWYSLKLYGFVSFSKRTHSGQCYSDKEIAKKSSCLDQMLNVCCLFLNSIFIFSLFNSTV